MKIIWDDDTQGFHVECELDGRLVEPDGSILSPSKLKVQSKVPRKNKRSYYKQEHSHYFEKDQVIDLPAGILQFQTPGKTLVSRTVIKVFEKGVLIEGGGILIPEFLEYKHIPDKRRKRARKQHPNSYSLIDILKMSKIFFVEPLCHGVSLKENRRGATWEMEKRICGFIAQKLFLNEKPKFAQKFKVKAMQDDVMKKFYKRNFCCSFNHTGSTVIIEEKDFAVNNDSGRKYTLRRGTCKGFSPTGTCEECYIDGKSQLYFSIQRSEELDGPIISRTNELIRNLINTRGVNLAKIFSIAIEATLECNDLVNLTSNQDSLQSKKALVTHQSVNNKMPLSTLKPSTNPQLNHKNVTITHGRNQPRYLSSCSSCPSGKTCGDIVETSNTNVCSGSHTKITSETECKNAAIRLGYTWRYGADWGDHPSGCYLWGVGFYYNTHSTGSGHSLSTPICQGCILECPAGQYLPLSSSQCKNCTKGRYGSIAGLRICTECPAGRYGSTTGLQSSSCTGTCDSGRYAIAGSEECNDCPKGRYGPTAGLVSLSECIECPSGRYGSTTGLQTSSCTGACNPGSRNLTGSVHAQCSSCPLCPSGKTCGDIVETSNTNVCSGSHTKITSETECKNAAIRLGYTWRYGADWGDHPSGCYLWGVGFYYNTHSTGSGHSLSTPICQGCIPECPAGQYLPLMSSQCKNCPNGRYGSTAGLRLCTECPAGRYGSTIGLQSSSCTGACNPGSPKDPGSVNTHCSSSLCPQVPSECQTSVVTLSVSTETALKNAVLAANNGGTSSYVEGMYRCDDFLMDVDTNILL
eukprot:g129.t1